jgi:hypothetical protein
LLVWSLKWTFKGNSTLKLQEFCCNEYWQNCVNFDKFAKMAKFYQCCQSKNQKILR